MATRVNWICVVLVLVAGPAFAQEQIVWQTDIAKAVKQAKAEKKMVLVHFYGDACAPCRVVEQKVFPEPQVVQAVMRNYVPVKINVDKEEKVAARYAIRGIPTDVFLVGGTGQEAYRAVTKESATEYATMLDQYAVQTGVGAARQEALRDRESRYDSQRAAPSPEAQRQYVTNQFAVQTRNVNNRYSQLDKSQTPPPVEGIPQSDGATAYGGPAAGSQSSQPPAGPYGSQAQEQASQPVTVEGYVPQGSQRGPSSQPAMQRANFQDPGDITARQPIHNQYVPVKEAPPVGMGGYCPVSISPPGPGKEGVWKKGDPRFGAVHRQRTYLFASAAEQAKFLADPDAYSPVLSGADPVIFAEQGQLVDGKRNIGMSIAVGSGRNEIYLFATEENLERFKNNVQEYTTHARQAVMKGETERKYR